MRDMLSTVAHICRALDEDVDSPLPSFDKKDVKNVAYLFGRVLYVNAFLNGVMTDDDDDVSSLINDIASIVLKYTGLKIIK